MIFKDNEHKIRYENYLIKDGTYINDVERNSMFYILSSDESIHKRIKKIYNFKHRNIEIDGFLEIRNELNSAATKMVYLAYQLYNNFRYSNHDIKDMTILDMLSGLDEENFEVCMRAIRIRFKKQE